MNENKLIDEKTCEIKREILNGMLYSTLPDCTNEFAKSVEQLEQGDLIFIYKSTEEKGVENELLEVSIRMNNNYTVEPDSLVGGLDKFIVEIYTENYSVIYPHVPRTYLDVELYEILKDSKVPQDVLITYKQIIEDLEV